MVLPTLKKLKRVPPGVPMRSEFLMLCLHVFTCAFTGITHELRSVMRSLSSQRLRGFMWPVSGRLAMQREFSTLLRGSDSGLLIYMYIYPSIHPSIHSCMHACMHAYIHTCIRTYTVYANTLNTTIWISRISYLWLAASTGYAQLL